MKQTQGKFFKNILSFAGMAAFLFLVSCTPKKHCNIGEPWNECNLIYSFIIENFYFGPSFVAAGDAGKAWWSDDGKVWSETGFPARNSANGIAMMGGIAFNGNKFVGVGVDGGANDCAVWISKDGKSWLEKSCPPGALPTPNIVYGNGLFWSGTGNGLTCSLMSSPDGENWIMQTAPAGCTDIRSLAFDKVNRKLYAAMVVGSEIIYEYQDSWIPSPVVAPTIFSAFMLYASSAGLYLLGFGTAASIPPCGTSACDVAATYSGGVWTNGNVGFAANTTSELAYGNGTYVAVGSNCGFSYATSITAWTPAAAPCADTTPFVDVKYLTSQKQFVTGGGTMGGVPVFAYSADGTSWTPANTLPASTGVYTIGIAE